MNSTLIKPVDLKKEDLVFYDLVVSDVTTFNSKKGNPLVSLKLVGLKSFATINGILYFGERNFEELSNFRGQKVNVLLASGNQGFNVREVYPVQ